MIAIWRVGGGVGVEGRPYNKKAACKEPDGCHLDSIYIERQT